MLTNTEIEQAFELTGKLMELHGENTFKARSYTNAAFQISKLNKELSEMSAEEIAAIPGVGAAIQEKILAMLETNQFPLLDQLLQKTPEGVLQMMRIKGLGPKKVAVIWKELGIESIGELEYACRENRLSLLKGFGAKTQQNVLEKIEFMKRSAGKVHYAVIEREVLELQKQLKKLFGKDAVSVTGAFRRRDVVIDRVEFVVIGDAKTIQNTLRDVTKTRMNETGQIVLTEYAIPFVLIPCSSAAFIATLFKTTGSETFLKTSSFTFPEHASDEEDIFKHSSLPYLIPEMRNGKHEWEWVKQFGHQKIVDVSDIKGIIHTHTTWSDGANTIEEMVQQSKQMGMEYLFISDHSVSAFYANGLNTERIREQHREIDRLNQTLTSFTLFKSIECDILADGKLDYPNEVLATFDAVIVSIHSVLNMDIEKATRRLLKAIENPYTTILGHPSGRLLLSRPGYALHYEKIIDACSAHRVVIELNANPWRLDLDWEWIYYAMNKGVKISINPDAHSIEGLHDIHYGTLAARKGGLTTEFLFNAMNAEEMKKYLQEKKKHIAHKALH